MNGWIDFKKLRANLDFEEVLTYYGVEVKRKGEQHHGFCPLPNHQGKRNSPSFSANLERGIFQCFGCGAKGNVLDFAAMMEKTDPENGGALRGVAVKLQKEFCPELAPKTDAAKVNGKPAFKEQAEPDLLTKVNVPLDFVLKGLDQAHPYLLGRGFTAETIAHFGLGFCSRGMLKDRIAIPLHDHEGRLVGYAGRVVDDAAITEDNPRYRLPGTRKRDAEVFEFRKTLFLYNGFEFKEPISDLIVVEGFTSVWWLWQNGLSHVVATMGSDCSERQSELITSLVKPDGRVWLVPDGDAAGERCARDMLILVSPRRFTRWVKLETGKQPTDIAPATLKSCFT
jgi:DNA primase